MNKINQTGSQGLKLVYAKRNGELVHISEVDSGYKCGCFCPSPSCNSPLIARKGEIRRAHFSHGNGAECAAAYETQLHLLAKKILMDQSCMLLPLEIMEVHSSGYRTNYRIDPHYPAGRFISLESVELEQRVHDFIPDLIIEHDGGKKLFVEIFVTHRVDAEKKEKLRSIGIPCLEINLSNFDISEDDHYAKLLHILVFGLSRKDWPFVPNRDEISELVVLAIEGSPIINEYDWKSKCPIINEGGNEVPDNSCPCYKCMNHMVRRFISNGPDIACIANYRLLTRSELEELAYANHKMERAKEMLVPEAETSPNPNLFLTLKSNKPSKGLTKPFLVAPSDNCECGGEYVIKRGYNSNRKFYGCNRWPDCDSTQSMKDMQSAWEYYDNFQYQRNFKCPECDNGSLRLNRDVEKWFYYCDDDKCGHVVAHIEKRCYWNVINRS